MYVDQSRILFKLQRKINAKVVLIQITENKIDNSKIKLQNIFKEAETIPEILKMHSVPVIANNTLEFRYYFTCFQKSCKIVTLHI